MSEGTRQGSQVEPIEAWTSLTDAPLAGLSLAREAGTLLAWDEGRNLYLFGRDGERLVAERAPAPIQAAAQSDDGGLVALLLGGPRLMLLDREFSTLADRPAIAGATCLAVDPHGRYIAIGSRGPKTQLYNRYGVAAGAIETRQPLALVRFLPSEPVLIGASGFGSLVAVELEPGASAEKLDGEVEWEERLLSNVGRLELSGDGSLILASCFNLGIQRYDRQGRNEGSYHLGGTATHAVPDFAGRSIAAATLEGELCVLNRGGNVRWKTALSRAATALEMDALGRFLVYGMTTGEIVRLDLEGRAATARSRTRPVAGRERAAAGPGPGGSRAEPAPIRPAGAPTARPGSVRAPDWTARVARSDEEAESAVLAVLDEPARVGFMTRGNRLQVFSDEGEPLGIAPELSGVGRILRTTPGWIASATDRMVLLYDARRNGATRVDLSLFEVTHLVIRPDQYGLAIVQERDRLGRATVAGRWVWRQELRTAIEDLALGPHGLTAVTDDAGVLHVYDAAGEPAGLFQADPAEPLLLVDAPEDAPDGALAWVSLARRAQVLRGHRADGPVLWESPTPWEPWSLQRVGAMLIVSAPDGRALSYDGGGFLRAQGGPEDSPFVLAPGPDGAVWRISRRDVHLICSDLSGGVVWRAIAQAPLGPLAAGRAGVAAMVGRELAFFASPG